MIDTTRSMMYHIGNLNSESQRISYQTSTGKVLEKGSDDAMLHSDLINLEDKYRVSESLSLQITKTRALNDTADVSMKQMKESLDKIKIDLMKALNDGMDRSDKLALASNIKGIRENMVDLVNKDVDGEHIFAGSFPEKTTMVKDKDYDLNGQIDFNGDAFLRKVAVQPGSYRERGITAHDVAFYNTDTSADDGAITFKTRELVVDQDGHTWKADLTDPNDPKLVKQDHNGIATAEYMEISSIVYEPKQFQIRGDVTTGETFTLNLTGGISGAQPAITYTAVAGDTANDIARELASQVDALGFMTATSDLDGNINWSSTEAISFTMSADKDAIFGAPEATYTTETKASATGAGRISAQTSSGLLLETKHNYFDDLNEIINALEGYETIKMENNTNTGKKGNIIENAKVDIVIQSLLDNTSKQYDATNVGHGELGGRNAVFNVAQEKISAQLTHYNILIQETGGADLVKLAMESKALEVTYQSLFSTISKMNQLSLVNYLK